MDWMCEMDPIMQLAEKKAYSWVKIVPKCLVRCIKANLPVQLVISVHGHSAKITTTDGESGMVTTNDETLWKKCGSIKIMIKFWQRVSQTASVSCMIHLAATGAWWKCKPWLVVFSWKRYRNGLENVMPAWHWFKRLLKNSPYFNVAKPSSDYLYATYKCYVQVNINAFLKDWSRDHIVAEINVLRVSYFNRSC